MPLINCKVKLSLNWIENCVLTTTANTNRETLTTTDAKRYVPIVTLSTEDDVKLSKLVREGFKRPIYWNKFNVIGNKVVEIANNDEEKYIRELLDSSYQGVKILFALAYDNTAVSNQVSVDTFRKHFSRVKIVKITLPRVKIENYNIEIDGRNFYNQPINDSIKQYDEIRKVSKGQGDDYTTGCLLDFG